MFGAARDEEWRRELGPPDASSCSSRSHVECYTQVDVEFEVLRVRVQDAVLAGRGGAMIAGSSRIFSPISWGQPSPAQASDLPPTFTVHTPRDAMTALASHSIALGGLVALRGTMQPPAVLRQSLQLASLPTAGPLPT